MGQNFPTLCSPHDKTKFLYVLPFDMLVNCYLKVFNCWLKREVKKEKENDKNLLQNGWTWKSVQEYDTQWEWLSNKKTVLIHKIELILQKMHAGKNNTVCARTCWCYLMVYTLLLYKIQFVTFLFVYEFPDSICLWVVWLNWNHIIERYVSFIVNLMRLDNLFHELMYVFSCLYIRQKQKKKRWNYFQNTLTSIAIQ